MVTAISAVTVLMGLRVPDTIVSGCTNYLAPSSLSPLSPPLPPRLKSLEHQTERSSREYPMGKLDALRADVEEAIKKFEDCQDAYATDMFAFLGKEQIYTHKLQQVHGVGCVCVCLHAVY